MNDQPLKMLLVEDNADDELLLRRELQKGGLNVFTKRVDNREDFVHELRSEDWDVVVSDFVLPAFDGLQALAAHRQIRPKTPFIIISGTVGEEVAVTSLKAGADDYLLKQNLIRLVPAVTKAIQNAGERQKRELTERSLNESRQRMELIVNAVSDFLIFWSVDEQGRFFFQNANPSFYRMLSSIGVSLSDVELEGRPIEEVESRLIRLAPANIETLRARREEALRTRKMVRFEEEFKFGDTCFLAEVSMTPILNEDGLCCYMLVDGRDISAKRRTEIEHRKLQNQLLQIQKAEALDTLSSELAHEFNNFLTGIIGFANFGLQSTDLATVRKCLLEITKVGQNAKQLIDRVKARSLQRSPLPRQPVDVSQVISEVLPVLRMTLPGTIVLSVDLPTPGPTILANSGQLQQIMLNLTNNAFHAIAANGRIEIKVDELLLNASDGDLLHVEPGQYARIVVRDNGVGMSEEVMKQVFDPFFTTKSETQGTGLGLTVVQRIVRDNDGGIQIKSQPGDGTEVSVLFPIASSNRPAVDQW